MRNIVNNNFINNINYNKYNLEDSINIEANIYYPAAIS